MRLIISKNKRREKFISLCLQTTINVSAKNMKAGYVEKYETIIVPPASKVKLDVNKDVMNTYVDYSMRCDSAALFMSCKP